MEEPDSSTHFQTETKIQILAERWEEKGEASCWSVYCWGEGQAKDASLIFWPENRLGVQFIVI